jgi:hypothetical protein
VRSFVVPRRHLRHISAPSLRGTRYGRTEWTDAGLSDFRDEIKAVIRQVNIDGSESPDRMRQAAQRSVDELFSLMKPPSSDA